jgi:hypothetical protein
LYPSTLAQAPPPEAPTRRAIAGCPEVSRRQ